MRMMTADQINRLILISLLSISIFLLLDCYVLPLDTSKGVVVTKTEGSLSGLRVAIYRVETERGLITVPPLAYDNIFVNDTIEVGRSFITHSNQKITIYRKGANYSWRLGFVCLGGLDFLMLLIVGNAVYLFFFYKKIEKAQVRRDITIFITFIFILFSLLNFLFK